MAQFDVYRNANSETRQRVPYLLDIQSELFASLSTRVVVPLMLASEVGRPLKELNPKVSLEEVEVVLSIPELAGLPVQLLGERVANLKHLRAEIISAIDFLITGS